jgi:rSAM/selenodomain-associated transferase 1
VSTGGSEQAGRRGPTGGSPNGKLLDPRDGEESETTGEGRVSARSRAGSVPGVAVAIVCKTPSAGFSKTRLSPPLRPEDCAVLAACFIRDVAATVHGLSQAGGVVPYAVYTPLGTEDVLRPLLASSFRLLPQGDGDLGSRLYRATVELLGADHAGVVLVNADSPTLPASILRAAASALRGGEDRLVLSPAFDGGYTLIGLTRPHARVFADIPWSTPQVYALTLERAAEAGVPVVEVPGWYDVDDGQTLRLLAGERVGERRAFAAPGLVGAPAPATRGFLQARRAPAGVALSC